MNTMWYIRTIECYLILKKKEIPSHDARWVNLKHVMPVTKTNTLWFHLNKLYKVVKLIESGSKMVVSREWEKEMRYWMGIEF